MADMNGRHAMNLRRIDIAYDASDAVRASLAGLGRTEDIAFSPDDRRLAIPSFARNTIGILAVDVATRDGRPTITVTDVVELSPPGLDHPHGVDFVDDTTIIVVNRHGDVTLFRLTADDAGVAGAALTPIELPVGGGFELQYGPSALAVARRPDGAHEVLIGHRYRSVLTRHVLRDDGDGNLCVTENEVLLREGIVVVDGVTVSPDGAWLALSNPMHQTVELYRRGPTLSDASKPRSILRGASYPHGVRFSADGRHLFVADGAGPYVHIHARVGDTWEGVHYPSASIRVMDDDVFLRGRHNARDGGPKGLDTDRAGRVLMVTSEFERLVCLDVEAIVEHVAEPREAHEVAVSYELDLARAADERVDERIAAFRRSTSFRMAQRLHRLKGLAGRRR
jgi:hypothetical protein